MKLILLAMLLCLSVVSKADDYEQSEQAANAKHANDFLRAVRLDNP